MSKGKYIAVSSNKIVAKNKKQFTNMFYNKNANLWTEMSFIKSALNIHSIWNNHYITRYAHFLIHNIHNYSTLHNIIIIKHIYFNVYMH